MALHYKPNNLNHHLKAKRISAMSENLLKQLQALENEAKGMPPVHLWNPEHVYNFDMRIDKEGRWFHEGSEIKRIKLVKLFASVLKNDNESYSLVTPVEQARIQVEDVPFIIVEMEKNAQGFVFRTNLDELVQLSEEHPIELRSSNLLANEEGELPYIKVRSNLWARFNRNVYYQAIEVAEEKEGKLVLKTRDKEFCIGKL